MSGLQAYLIMHVGSSLISMAFIAWCVTESEGWDDKENWVALLLGIVGGTLTLSMLIGVMCYEARKNQLRIRARYIMHKTGGEVSRAGAGLSSSQLIHTTVDDCALTAQAGVKKLSDKEIKFLLGIHKDVFSIDSWYIDALVDELVERELFKE
jgi:hypothetical protein